MPDNGHHVVKPQGELKVTERCRLVGRDVNIRVFMVKRPKIFGKKPRTFLSRIEPKTTR